MYTKQKSFLLKAVLFIFVFLIPVRCISQTSDNIAVEEYDLANHLKVLLIPTYSGNRTAKVLITVKTGSLMEGRFLGSGVSHFLEHLLFKGTENNTETELARRVKGLGGYVNAHTSFTYTQYYINLPSNNIDEALDILSSMILNCSPSEEEFLKEKAVVLREMDMTEDNMKRLLSKTFFQTHYFGTSMAFPIIGFKDTFSALTPKDVKEYYDLTYQPSNMILTVCGDFNKSTIKPKIEKLYGKKKNLRFKEHSFASIKRPIGTRVKTIEKPQITTTKTMIGFKSCSLDDSDLYALDVASEILGGGKSSRFKQKLLFKNLVNSINCYNYTPEYEGVFVIQFDCSQASNKVVMDIIDNELESLKKGELEENEIERAIQRVSLQYANSMETTSEKAFRFTDSFMFTGTMDFPKLYIRGLKRVTKEDISFVAKKYFKKDNLTTVYLKPKKDDNNKNDEIIKKSDKETLSKPELITLPNGLKIILKNKENILASYIHVYLKGGSSYEKEKEFGLSYLTSQMLLKGTNSLKQKELSEKIEFMGANLSPISGYNAMGLSLKVLNHNLEKAFPLLKDILLESSFLDDEFEIVKNQAKENIKKQKEDIFSTAILTLRKKMFSVHPYGRSIFGTSESIDNISAEQCKSYWKNTFTPDNLIISVTGAFDKDKILSLIKELFSKLKSNKFSYTPQINTFTPKGQESFKIFPSKQAAVLIGFNAPDYLSHKRYYYDFLDTFFSDQSSPLFESIRTEKGLAYMTGSVYIKGPFGGFFFFYCATSPNNKEKVKNLLLKNISNFNKTGITKKDFETTMTRFIAENYFRFETASSRSESSSFDELYGLGFDNYLKYNDHADKITLSIINNTLKNGFIPENAVILVVAPEDKEQMSEDRGQKTE
ncbi:MAG: insulinase family protein [Candidatus Aureabacteria bacterium]|nr:insulinase family protein [Candidatus Auribacterota bacterium]